MKYRGLVDRLKELEANGKLTTHDVREAALRVGKTERTVWRWISESGDPDESPTASGLEESWLVEVGVFRGNVAAAWRSLRDDGKKVPSLRTFQRQVDAELTASTRALLTEGDSARRRHEIYLTWSPPHRNAVWHGDHKELPIKVSKPRSKQLIRPWITTFVDGFSRRIMGYAISLRPTGAEVLAALGAGIARSDRVEAGGVPDKIVVDGGLEFVGEALEQAAAMIGSTVRVSPPYTPTFNGKIERWHRTLSEQLFAALPGYEGGPRKRNGELYGPTVVALTLEELQSIVSDWIEKYNATVHSAIGTSPDQAWRDDVTAVRDLDPEVLAHHFVIKKARTVRKEGIRFGGRDFFAAELNGLVGESIHIGYRPHDFRSVEVFWKDDWLCTAPAKELLTPEEIDLVMERRAADRKKQAALLRKVGRRSKERVAPLTGDTALDLTTSFTAEDLADVHDGERKLAQLRSNTDLLGFNEPTNIEKKAG